jgi:2'-5' RNA ligase
MAEYTGAMVALMPVRADAQRLAVEGGLGPEELHVTLMYLGEAADLDELTRTRIMSSASALAGTFSSFTADAFSVSMFNPNGEDPCIVLGLSGDQLAQMHLFLADRDGERFPQRSPYIPHMTLRYTDDTSALEGLKNRTGSVRFDRVRVAFGGEYVDFPFSEHGASITAAVNSRYWRSFPIAPRETKFNADDAISRALQWSGGSASKFNSIFLWRAENGQPTNPESYRLPIADIIGNRPTLIPRAVFSAAVILSGGHGGLEGVVDENEREELKNVINQIYAVLQEEYQDPRVRPPWLLGRTKEEREEDEEEMARTASLEDMGDDPYGQTVWHVSGLVASVNSNFGEMRMAATDHAWDGDAARKRVWEWSEGDYRRYRRAFLWWDAERPEQKNSYKLPIADVIDGELVLVPRAVNAVAAVLSGARGGVDIPDEDMDAVERVVNRLQKRMGTDREEVKAAAGPVYPHSSKFEWDGTDDGMPFTVLADGTARGLLWMWNRCHAGIVDECVMAPRSATNYAYFHNGQVLTSDGKLVKVGKITMGTGHAGPNMRWMPAADHYDNTGTVAAIGRVTDTPKGGFFNGVVVSTLDDEKIQELRRSPISGDWRRVNGTLELVAALAVNTPGFPIVASLNGEPQSLVAAGMIVDDEEMTASSGSEEKMNNEEKALVDKVDELDRKLVELAARGRGRRWGKLMAALDERKR